MDGWTWRRAANLGLLLVGVGWAQAGSDETFALASLEVMPADVGVTLAWRASNLESVLGVDVERLSDAGPIRISDDWIRRHVMAGPEESFRLPDPGAAQEGELRYRFTWIGFDGRRTVSAWSAAAWASPEASTVPVSVSRTQTAPVSPPDPLPLSGSGERVRVQIARDGVYGLSAEALAACLDAYSVAGVTALIAQTNLALSVAGDAVAWLPQAGNTGVLFFAEGYQDLYTGENTYWVDVGPGLHMQRTSVAPDDTPTGQWFWDTTWTESDVFFVPTAAGGPEDDYFIWDYTQVDTFDPAYRPYVNAAPTVVDPAPGVVTAAVSLALASYTDLIDELDHSSELLFNSVAYGSTNWHGDERIRLSGIVTNFQGEGDVATLHSTLLPSVTLTSSIVVVDGVYLTYPREQRLWDGFLRFKNRGYRNLTVEGVSSGTPWVLSVDDPRRPVVCDDVAVLPDGGEWQVSWLAEGLPGDEFVGASMPITVAAQTHFVGVTLPVTPLPAASFVCAAAPVAPASLQGTRIGPWLSTTNTASHLVIAPEALSTAAQALVAYRNASESFDSLLVPLQEVYDSFSHGRRTPWAIRAFLQYASEQWASPPGFATLIGAGHLDYRNVYWGTGARINWIQPPTVRCFDSLSSTHYRSYPGDNPIADWDGDRVPNIPIGRLPARNAPELTAMINKIIAYESVYAWKTNATFVADRVDEAGDFEASCDRLAAVLPPDIGVAKRYVDVDGTMSVRNGLISDVNAGRYLWVYVGHGNNYGIGLTAPRLLETGDYPLLTQSQRAGVMMAMTCQVNSYGDVWAGYECFGEGLLNRAVGGCSAVWAPSSESYNVVAEELANFFLEGVYESRLTRLGDAVMDALGRQAALGTQFPFVISTSTLFGDPAMRVAPRPSTYEEWRRTWWSEPAASNDAVSGTSANPDLDVPDNLTEFLTGSDPTDGVTTNGIVLYPAVETVVEAAATNQYALVSYNRRRWTDGVRYEWWTSTNLVSGGWSEQTLRFEPDSLVSISPDLETATYRDLLGLTNAIPRFVELKAVLGE